MALFVFGAGATRGCSFVDPSDAPCLPPLDFDFFTQLQRIKNRKHKALVSQVMADVVELFGNNFSVSLETVFTTLEHTIRMIKVTGGSRDFDKDDLELKRERLKQAIAAVFEDSLAGSNESGASKHIPKDCEYHKAFVENILRRGDDIVSFNYDCVLDFALKNYGAEKWSPRYGYGFNLGPGGNLLKGDDFWQPEGAEPKRDTAHLFKLHGSLHFRVSNYRNGKQHVTLKQRPYTKQNERQRLRFEIIPPEWHKNYDEGVFATLWKEAAAAIHRATKIVMIGYSLPLTDLHSTTLFRTSIKKGRLRSLVIVNPDREARLRTRQVLLRGLSKSTKVLSFDYLNHFTTADRSIWG